MCLITKTRLDSETETLIPTAGGVFDAVAIQGTLIGRSDNAGPNGSGADDTGTMFTLTKTDVHAVAIQDVRAVEKAQNGRGWNDDGSAYTVDTHATQGVAVAFGVGEQPDVGHCLRSGASKADKHESTTYVAQPYIGGVDYENNAHGMDEATGPLLKGSPTGGGRPLPAIATTMQVRRLTPVECERLQGFPDGYTNIPWRGKPESPDGPRYKALGNSMAVPVMRWIGERINEVSKL